MQLTLPVPDLGKVTYLRRVIYTYLQSNHRLNEHHLETLIAEFTNTMESPAQLHDALITLRWAVAESDADLEKPAGNLCSSAEEFFRTISNA